MRATRSVELRLSVNGFLTFPTTTGLTFVTGSNGGNLITVRGTLADLNAALDGLVFRPGTNFTGNFSLQVTHQRPGQQRLRRSPHRHRLRHAEHHPGQRRPAERRAADHSGDAGGHAAHIQPGRSGSPTWTSTIGRILSPGPGHCRLRGRRRARSRSHRHRRHDHRQRHRPRGARRGDHLHEQCPSDAGVHTRLPTPTTLTAPVQIRVTTDDLANGGPGALTDTDIFTVRVTPVNDAPTSAGLPPVAVAEDASPTSITLSDYFADIDDAPPGSPTRWSTTPTRRSSVRSPRPAAC